MQSDRILFFSFKKYILHIYVSWSLCVYLATNYLYRTGKTVTGYLSNRTPFHVERPVLSYILTRHTYIYNDVTKPALGETKLGVLLHGCRRRDRISHAQIVMK